MENLEFLFEAVSGLLHMSGTGGASELRASKFNKRCESYRESQEQMTAIDVAELILSATRPLAEEVKGLIKRVKELEDEKFNREITVIDDVYPDDL